MKKNNLLFLPPVILSFLAILLSGSKCKRQQKDWCSDSETHKTLCKHFCLLKQDGKSTFRYTHVHIAGKKGKFDPAQDVTGIGHDDETPAWQTPLMSTIRHGQKVMAL